MMTKACHYSRNTAQTADSIGSGLPIILDKGRQSVAIVIVNYNTREHLRGCLATAQVAAPAEIIVVDNASSDGSVEMVRAEYPQVRLYANKTNQGYGAAANQGIGGCSAKYVLLLNSDTLLHPGTLESLRYYLDMHMHAAIVGPRLMNPDGTLQASCYPFPTPLNLFLQESTLERLIRFTPILRNVYLRTWPHSHARSVPWVLGAALAIRCEAFATVGGFDQTFYMYYEEVDLCYRLRAAGWQTHFAPVANIVHTGGASTIQRRAEMRTRFFMSMLLFYRKHYSRLRRVMILVLIQLIALAQLIRSTLYLRCTSTTCNHVNLIEDQAVWLRLLLDPWQGW